MSNEDESHSKLSIWLSMIQSYRSLQAELGMRLKTHFALSLPQFQLLSQLAFHPEGIPMTQLAKALFMSNGNVTGLAGRLEKQGWVEFTKDKSDKRITILRFSQQGQNQYAHIREAYEIWVNELFKNLNETQAKDLRDMMHIIRP